MTDITKIGYAGKILRVDLSESRIWDETLDEPTVKKWLGGVGLGAYLLYQEVPPGVQWSDPENRLIWTTGLLAGSGVAGAATINIMAKGPMTHTAGSFSTTLYSPSRPFGSKIRSCRTWYQRQAQAMVEESVVNGRDISGMSYEG